ncbi:MAG: glycoside hydrolase family 3 N-terminal domain-containing protein [Francisellaceae bacterium]
MQKIFVKFWLSCVAVIGMVTLANANIDNTRLEHAVGQMLMVGMTGTVIDENAPIVQQIKNHHIGGVVLFPYDETKKTGNIKSPEQLRQLTEQLQYFTWLYNKSNYPLLISVNEEGGVINGLRKSAGFDIENNRSTRGLLGLSQQEIGQFKTIELDGHSYTREDVAYDQAKAIGDMLWSYGVNMNYAPVAAVDLNENSTVIHKWERSFSQNPQVVSELVEKSLLGYKHADMIAVMKHFPGLGSATQNTDWDPVVDVTDQWQEIELDPYRSAIASKNPPSVIMIGHTINKNLDASGLPASLSEKVITDLLRHKLGFNGVTITDDMHADAIYYLKIPKYPGSNEMVTVTDKKAIYYAVMAGEDILLYGGSLNSVDADTAATEAYNNLLALAKENPAVKEKVLKADERITGLKRQIGR